MYIQNNYLFIILIIAIIGIFYHYLVFKQLNHIHSHLHTIPHSQSQTVSQTSQIQPNTDYYSRQPNIFIPLDSTFPINFDSVNFIHLKPRQLNIDINGLIDNKTIVTKTNIDLSNGYSLAIPYGHSFTGTISLTN